LYDLRLACYPEALRITEPLRKSHLSNKDVSLNEEYLQHVLEELDSWHTNKAAFLLSYKALDALYELRQVLRDKPADEGSYSEAQIQRIWKSKGKFREELRRDIFLLFGEELDRNV
jgi:hypothetical protein